MEKYEQVQSPISARPRGGSIPHVCIVVLGDVGRSPRMQYHADSFLKNGWSVSIVGYCGVPCLDSLSTSDKVSIHRFDPPLKKLDWLKRRSYLMFAILKFVALSILLLHVLLFKVGHCDVFLVQNPPSLPSLPCVLCASLWKRSAMVIDWHNIGATMFPYHSSHPLSIVLSGIEAFFGRISNGSLCVSKAMKLFLSTKFRVSAEILYDRPPAFFSQRIGSAEKRLLLKKVFAPILPTFTETHRLFYQNYFSESSDERGSNGLDRKKPAMVITSTSYTADEDLQLFLDALALCDTKLSEVYSSHPGIVALITGKGERKQQFEEIISKMSLKNVSIGTLWLEAGDFPVFLQCANLGVSLHVSTSGVDLPMKLVDLLGAGVPVCAFKYGCIEELVTTNRGKLFTDAEGLSTLVIELLVSAIVNSSTAGTSKTTICKFESWEENWNVIARPYFGAIANTIRRDLRKFQHARWFFLGLGFVVALVHSREQM